MIDAPTRKNGALAGAAARCASIAAGPRREEGGEPLSRRDIAVLGLPALLPLGARAEARPSNPIRMIVPYAPGGTSEHLASAMVAETAGWAEVVEDTGFKVD
ncbi:MAG: hypothetical protein Q7S91_03035 [Aquabacterium sp.]|nr:hypothetical protein [Aquabacterium sp.]